MSLKNPWIFFKSIKDVFINYNAISLNILHFTKYLRVEMFHEIVIEIIENALVIVMFSQNNKYLHNRLRFLANPPNDF